MLNRGFNFPLLPLKLDITQTLVEYKRFERAAIWNKFHHGKDDQETNDEPIFKTYKTNLPKNYTSPEGLKTFLSSVKSELMDPRNRNYVPCNLPNDEMQALRQLQKLQREQKIVVKACDKGAGIIILNFEDYLKACHEHLTSNQKVDKPYYTEASDLDLEISKKKVNDILKEALDSNIIDQTEFNAMNAEDKKAGRFYCNFKVHKQHKHLPPPRPIVSGSGSITENIG